jgi:hypothetical protein
MALSMYGCQWNVVTKDSQQQQQQQQQQLQHSNFKYVKNGHLTTIQKN